MVKAERMVLDSATATDVATWLGCAQTDGAIALIDKQEQWTSFDCVAKLRNRTRVKRVGHAGTLDPLATGLLVICFGKATKDIQEIQDGDKEYIVTIRLGATSTTDDRAGEITAVSDVEVDAERIKNVLSEFEGTITQIPPDYSAVRHGGRRQYDMARQGQEFVAKPRIVDIDAITNVTVQWPLVTCTIACSKGTYIRSIARDLGAKLGCGAYVETLRRTRSGSFDVAKALTVDAVIAAVSGVQA